MKIFIAVPCMDSVAAGFAQSLATLSKIGECSVSFYVGSLIYDSRNRLAEQAVEYGADYVLWLDSDMIFNPDFLVRLMETLGDDKAIATGIYFRRTMPYTPVLFSKLESIDDKKIEWEGYDDYPKDSIFEIAGCGFGGILMKIDVIIEMFMEFGTCFAPIGHCGEDVAFCIRAHKLGYKIYCNSAAKMGHVGHMIVTEQFCDTMMKGNKNEG